MNILKIIGLITFLSLVACANSSGGSGEPSPDEKVSQFCKNISFPSGHRLHYCVRGAAKSSSLLYFLHGAGGESEDIFRGQFDSAYQLLSEKQGAQTPTVIGLSFGDYETIPVEVGTLDPQSLHELTDIAMPLIENDLGFDSTHIPVRNLMGLSLGGFNALNFAAARPVSFKSVTALCPALIDFDPFDDGQIGKYLSRNVDVIDKSLLSNLIGLLRGKFVNLANWRAADPFNKIESGKLASLPIFISTGAQDDYGFFEGAQEFTDLTKPINPLLKWVPTTGKHCSFDGPQFVEFLSTYIPHK